MAPSLALTPSKNPSRRETSRISGDCFLGFPAHILYNSLFYALDRSSDGQSFRHIMNCVNFNVSFLLPHTSCRGRFSAPTSPPRLGPSEAPSVAAGKAVLVTVRAAFSLASSSKRAEFSLETRAISADRVARRAFSWIACIIQYEEKVKTFSPRCWAWWWNFSKLCLGMQ